MKLYSKLISIWSSQFNSDAIQKAKKAEEAADEYEKVLTAANDRQTLHYSEELPTAVNVRCIRTFISSMI